MSITRAQRSMLLFLSASGYVAWFAGVGAQIQAQGVVDARSASITLLPPPKIPKVAQAIERDPFAGSPDAEVQLHDDSRRETRDLPAAAADGAATGSGATDGSVPDIAGAPPGFAPASSALAPMTLVVRATIVGRTSVAYVANGSAMDIVRVGDSLGDRRITKIDLEGIAFADGSRLDLASGYEATPQPIRSREQTLAIPIEQLRKLLAQPAIPTVAPSEPDLSRTPAPTPTPGPAITPEPIHTVDSRGIAPGTNPTPDLNAPTAYPYPYPYPAAQHR